MMGLMSASAISNNDASNDMQEEMVVRMDNDIVTATSTNKNLFLEEPMQGEEETHERRNKELSRLDNLLVVPPELEIQPGQFDDADSDDDDPLL